MAEYVHDWGKDRCVLAVVCGSPVMLSGFERVLANAPGMIVKYPVRSVTDLQGRVPAPDLVVIDVNGLSRVLIDAAFWAALPGGQGAVMLCRPEDPPDLISALHGGVRGFLTHACQSGELVAAVRTAWRGGVHVSPDLARTLVAQSRGDDTVRSRLSQREAETLRLVAAGFTHGQIGRRMGLTEATVSTYVRRIRVKLDAGNKADLTRVAINLGYTPADRFPPPPGE
jgi:two-component system, NarL family, invasion response regulator UvrY